MSTGLRIVVADDEPEMRDFFDKVLPRLGHKVVAVAENGNKLVEHCRQQKPDLVITDLKMPGLDGIEACSRICQERAVPVILVTAYPEPTLIARAEAEHVLVYLVKPIGLADLQPAISIAMRRLQELQMLQGECNDLRQAFCDRIAVQRAKELLIQLAGIDEEAAFQRLQQIASEKNHKLIEAAQSILALETTFDPKS